MSTSINVNSISRAASILNCIAAGTSRITQIASRTGLSNGTTHRLLKTLQKEGFIEQDPLTLKYALGPLLIALATNPMVTHANLISCAIEEMEILRQNTEETIGLVIRSGLERLHLEELPSKQALKYTMGKGFVAPLHLSASSKVLLSEIQFEDRDKLLRLIEEKNLKRKSDFKKADLFKEVALVEKNGYATSFEEFMPGASSIAVPVKGYVVPVAMCIFGPLERFDLKTMKKVLPGLKRASKRITKKLA